MSKEITKSAEVLEKEALIKEMQIQLTKRKRILKGLKTRLKNTQEDITQIQRAGNGTIISKMSQMEKLRLELVDLIGKLMKIKGLSRADKAVLKSMEGELDNEDMFGPDFKAFREQMNDMEDFDFEAQFGAEERAKMRDIFESFAVKPNKEEQKDIRKVFISLSQKFHPDKATTKADEAEYHHMMQQINEAYKSGDIQTLLELEQLFLSENLDLTKVQALSIDVLQSEIDRLERDLQFIENQIDRNKQELKNLRSSDLGKMLTDMKKADKEGEGMDAAISQLDESIDHLKMLQETLQACIESGSLEPLESIPMLGGANQPSQADMMSMLEEMLSGKVDPNDLEAMFGNLDDDDDDDLFDFEEDDLANVKFKVGSSVEICKKVIDEESGLDLSGLVGRVEDVYYGIHLGDLIYEIELDSISIDKLPPDYVKRMVPMYEDFQKIELEEEQLKKCQPRDTIEESLGAYRKKYHQYFWDSLPDAEKQTLQTILLQDPSLTDWENWKIYLNKELNFPISAKSRGLMEFRRGEKFKITGLAGYNKEVGFIVNVHFRNRAGNYPLFDLMPATKAKKLQQIFEVYLIWVQEEFDV